MTQRDELVLDLSIMPDLVNNDLNNQATIQEQRFLWAHADLWKAILEEKKQQIETVQQKLISEFEERWEKLKGTYYDEAEWDNFVDKYKYNMDIADNMLAIVDTKIKAIQAENNQQAQPFAVNIDEIELDFDDDTARDDFTLFHKNWHYGYYHGAKKMYEYFMWLIKFTNLKQPEITALLDQFIKTELRNWIITENPIPSFKEWKEQHDEKSPE